MSGSFLVYNKASTRFANELDGISMVVAAMKQFPNDSPLQRRCCMLLANLGNRDDLRAIIKKTAHVGSLAGAALDNHPHDAKLAYSVKEFFDAMSR